MVGQTGIPSVERYSKFRMLNALFVRVLPAIPNTSVNMAPSMSAPMSLKSEIANNA